MTKILDLGDVHGGVNIDSGDLYHKLGILHDEVVTSAINIAASLIVQCPACFNAMRLHSDNACCMTCYRPYYGLQA